MKGNFLLGLGVGVLAAYLWRQMSKKAGKAPTELTVSQLGGVAQDVIVEEGGKFGEALKKEYDIVLIPNKYSKAVKEKAKEFTDRRYALKADNINNPVSL